MTPSTEPRLTRRSLGRIAGAAAFAVPAASALSVVFFVAVGLIIIAQLALSRRLEARFS